MSDRAEVKLTILEAVVKGYHECSFAVHVGDKFIVKQKRGDRGPALRVTDDDRGQLGHLQRELVIVLLPLAYIACVLQQLLQTPLAVLIEIYFEVMRTLLALVVTILFTLYTVACVQIQLQWSFSSYLSEALATTE